MDREDLVVVTIVLVVFNVSLIAAYLNAVPNPGHGGDEVFIRINGNDISLQQAINDGEFNSVFTGTSSYSGGISNGHPGEGVIVNVAGIPKILQQAINDDSLCNAELGTSPSNFGSVNGQSQTGDEILIDFGGEKTLQQAINDGEFEACVIPPFTGNVALTPRGGASYDTPFMDHTYLIGSNINVINDGSSSGSYFGVNTYNTDGSDSGSTVDVIITFAEPVTTLTNINLVYDFKFVNPSIPGSSWAKLENTQIKTVGGSWTTAPGGGGSQERWDSSWDIDVSGSWSNVEAIKIQFRTWTSAGGEFWDEWYFQSSWKLYEITATGTQ